MSNIRQRHSSGRSAYSASMSGEEMDPFTPGAGLSAKAMIDAAPQHHGSVQKLHIPTLYSVLPAFIQRFILAWSCLKSLAPTWKERHLILCGSYLYKFKDAHSTSPKGSPFDIQILNTDFIPTTELSEVGNLPEGYTSIFTVSTLRRRHYYAVSDNEEALLWVRSLHEARHEAITRNMGHASNVPYPASWRHFDTLGKGLVKSKERIKEKLEMTSLTDEQMPRGYYG